jgi:hypothetical protein
MALDVALQSAAEAEALAESANARLGATLQVATGATVEARERARAHLSKRATCHQSTLEQAKEELEQLRAAHQTELSAVIQSVRAFSLLKLEAVRESERAKADVATEAVTFLKLTLQVARQDAVRHRAAMRTEAEAIGRLLGSEVATAEAELQAAVSLARESSQPRVFTAARESPKRRPKQSASEEQLLARAETAEVCYG